MDRVHFWTVDRHEPLTTQVRAYLLATYGYNAPAQHTHAALISIRAESPSSFECVDTFPFTFVLAGAQTGELESQIDTACRARLLALRNAAPLTAILGIRHQL